jgi:hypothetical protein
MGLAAIRLVVSRMASVVLLPALLFSTGCFTVHVGEGDLNPITYDETFIDLPDLAVAPDGDVEIPTKTGDVMTATIATDGTGARILVFPRNLVVFDQDKAAFELNRFGPSKLSGIQSISLTRVSAAYDGLDLGRVAAPSLTIGTRTLGPADDTVDLDGTTVSDIRTALLVPEAVVVPLTLTLVVPPGAESALGSELHVTIVLQPLLTIDGSSAL